MVTEAQFDKKNLDAAVLDDLNPEHDSEKKARQEAAAAALAAHEQNKQKTREMNEKITGNPSTDFAKNTSQPTETAAPKETIQITQMGTVNGQEGGAPIEVVNTDDVRIQQVGAPTTQPNPLTDAITVCFRDANGNVFDKQYLTAPQIQAIRNFAKNKRDTSDGKGFKLKITKDLSDIPSEKYYSPSTWSSSKYYRKDDPDQKPLTFENTTYSLSESQYEAALSAIQEYDKRYSKTDTEMAEAIQQQKKVQEKNWLVRGADWVQRNIFDSLADLMPFEILGTPIKMLGNILTGPFRTIGYAFDCNWSKAGEAGWSWLKDTAIAAAAIFGVYYLGKKMEWWGNKKKTTTQTTSSTTNNNNTDNSSGSNSGNDNSNSGNDNTNTDNGSSGNTGTTTTPTTTVSVRHSALEGASNMGTSKVDENLYDILNRTGTIRGSQDDGTIYSTKLDGVQFQK